jgi:hypothetical protein
MISLIDNLEQEPLKLHLLMTLTTTYVVKDTTYNSSTFLLMMALSMNMEESIKD